MQFESVGESLYPVKEIPWVKVRCKLAEEFFLHLHTEIHGSGKMIA